MPTNPSCVFVSPYFQVLLYETHYFEFNFKALFPVDFFVFVPSILQDLSDLIITAAKISYQLPNWDVSVMVPTVDQSPCWIVGQQLAECDWICRSWSHRLNSESIRGFICLLMSGHCASSAAGMVYTNASSYSKCSPKETYGYLILKMLCGFRC